MNFFIIFVIKCRVEMTHQMICMHHLSMGTKNYLYKGDCIVFKDGLTSKNGVCILLIVFLIEADINV